MDVGQIVDRDKEEEKSKTPVWMMYRGDRGREDEGCECSSLVTPAGSNTLFTYETMFKHVSQN